MCVSLLVENDPAALATSLGLAQVGIVDAAGEHVVGKRVEARMQSLVLRLGAGGRIVAEPMSFNPYVVRRRNITGDLWAHSLLGESHGLIVVRAFSEWASGARLVGNGLANVFEINCAFNRFATSNSANTSQERRDRLVLGNFTPMRRGTMLVPVLFDVSRRPDATTKREFAIITREPPPEVARTGAGHAPVSLTADAALTWLHAVSAEDPLAAASVIQDVDTDFEEVLEDGRDESFAFALFKSA